MAPNNFVMMTSLSDDAVMTSLGDVVVMTSLGGRCDDVIGDVVMISYERDDVIHNVDG